MGKDIQLLDYDVEEHPLLKGHPFQKEQPSLKYKKKITSLKSYGIILCFEADVPKAEDMIDNQFQINLLHDSSEPNNEFGIRVMQLAFNFAPEEYISLRENNVTFKKGGHSEMTIMTSGSDNYVFSEAPEVHSNPIGQTGVHINVVIIAEEHFYNISINGGDFIHFQHRIPPWTVNYVMISGDIKNVKFEEDSNQCQKKNQQFN
uniref:Galectin n=1 Tax=Meloidogyne incognita TaxID=6306 RepID=A0A914L615_MELIC